MNKEDKKIQKHLIDEMMKVCETNPDVMFYMETLMEKYEKQEQKILELQQELLNKKLNVKDIEYKEKMIYKSRNEKAIENIDLVIELIKQQPTEDDTWILNKLNGFKYILTDGDDNDN